MVLLDRIKSFFTVKQETKNHDYEVETQKFWHTWTGFGSLFWNRENEERLIQNSYIQNEDIYAILELILKNSTTIPLKVKEYDKKSEKWIDVKEDNALQKLIDRPNREQNGQEYRYEQYINYLLTGDTFEWKNIGIGYTLPTSLRILPSQFVQVERVDVTDFFSDIKRYTFQIGRMMEFMKEDVIWTQKLDPSYYCEKGLSPLTPLANATSTSNQVHVAEANMIENRGATGMISSDMTEGYGMTTEQKEELENEFKQRSGGARNFNKTLVSPGRVKYTQLGLSPKDLLLTELDINKMRKFCNVYGLSSQLLNDPANKTFNNLGEAKKSLYTEVCIPLVETFVNSWAKDLVPLFEAKDKKKYKICIETEDIEVLQGDKKLEAEKNNIMMQSIMSISKAVKMNEIDREQAINILVFSHNLTLEEAESFISMPTIQPTTQNNM